MAYFQFSPPDDQGSRIALFAARASVQRWDHDRFDLRLSAGSRTGLAVLAALTGSHLTIKDCFHTLRAGCLGDEGVGSVETIQLN